MGNDQVDPDIVTPVEALPFPFRLITSAWLTGLVARLLAWRRKPVKLGAIVMFPRHADCLTVLSRDEYFSLEPVYKAKLTAVNEGPFILGMDRSPIHSRERKALYDALNAVDLDWLKNEAEADLSSRLAAIPAGGEIDVVGGYARLVAAATSQRLFGINGSNDAMFMEVTRSIFGYSFGGDDKKSRDRAVKAGHYMAKWFRDEIARRRATGTFGEDMMGRLMEQAELDDDGVRRTLGGMLVGSVDTTATCVAKIVKTLGKDGGLAAQVRSDVDDLERMDGWCNELLRRWPHNPFIPRKVIRETELGGRTLKPGQSAFAFTQAAMLDPDAFPEPAKLRPDRDPNLYMHLGHGIHPCAGRVVNRFQIPLLVAGLLRRGLAGVGPIKWAAAFPHRMMARLG
jgi:cytochrome P450